jgi:outer membrane protein OmpA-like peptidoglycan-associated protein
MPEAPRSSADFGTETGGFRVLSSAECNLRILAWGYWPVQVIKVFGPETLAAVQTLTPSSLFVFDSTELKPQGADGQEAIRLLFRALAPLPFAKGVILKGNAMTCMQLARLLRESATDKRIEFVDTLPFGT